MRTEKPQRKHQSRIRDYLDDANDEYSLYHGREYLKGFGDFTPPRERNEVKNANTGVPLEPLLDYDYLLKISQRGNPQSSLSLDPLSHFVTVVFLPVLLLGIAAATLGFLTRRMWFTSRKLPSENLIGESLTTKTNGEEDIATSNSSNTHAINYDDKSLTVSSKKCDKKETTDHETDWETENHLNHPPSPIEKINIGGEDCNEPHYELPRKKLIFSDNDGDERGTSEVPSPIITACNKFSQVTNENESDPPGLSDEANLSAVALQNTKPFSYNYDNVIHPSRALSSQLENDQSHFSTPQRHQKVMMIPNSIYKTPAEYDLNELLTPHMSRTPSGIGTIESRHSNEIVSDKNTFQPNQLSTPSTGQESCSVQFPREAVVSYFQSRGLSQEKSLEKAADLEVTLLFWNQSMSFIKGVLGYFSAQWGFQYQEIYEQGERHHDQQMKARPIEKLQRVRKKFSFSLLNLTLIFRCTHCSMVGLGLSFLWRVWDETGIGTLWNVVEVLISKLCSESNAQPACTETSWTSYFMSMFGSYPLQYIQSMPCYSRFGCLVYPFASSIIIALFYRFINKVVAMIILMIMSRDELRMLLPGVGLSIMNSLLLMNTHRYFVDPSREWKSSSSNTSRTARELTLEEVNQKVDWYENASQKYQYVANFMSLCVGLYTGWCLYWTV